jgi:hypothetical protein
MLDKQTVERKLDAFATALGVTIPRNELPEASGHDADGNPLWREETVAAFMQACSRLHATCNAVSVNATTYR